MSENFVHLNAERYIVRLGYRGFLSAVWMLWKMNRNGKQLGIVTKAEFILPVPWLK